MILINYMITITNLQGNRTLDCQETRTMNALSGMYPQNASYYNLAVYKRASDIIKKIV